jgi:hypothetical protein
MSEFKPIAHHRGPQAVVRGVPEEIGGAHIVAMMCRFGAGTIRILSFLVPGLAPPLMPSILIIRPTDVESIDPYPDNGHSHSPQLTHPPFAHADGHCWFYKAPNAQSWVLSDPSGAGSGDSSRWGGLEWSDVRAKCTGVFRTREKTLGTFKPCLFVYASGSEDFGDDHGDADARGDDEQAERRQCDDLLSHDKV